MNTIDQAIAFAAQAHQGQLRKSTQIPYISHPYAVAMMLCRIGCSEEVIVAGLLHDTLEDTQTSVEQLDRQFGDRVTEIVLGCSEPDKSLSWEARKEHTIASLADASLEIKLVSCADKLHNLRCMLADQDRVGEGLWERFKRGRVQQAWYYRSLVMALVELEQSELGQGIYQELRETVEKLFAD